MQDSATDIMPAFKRVLVATDFSPASQAAFRTALDTCGSLGASMVVLHVCEYPRTCAPETGGFLIEQQVLCEQCRNGLEELRRDADHAGVASETILAHGVAAACILDTATAKKIDLVVLGTNALHGFERLVFGSTAEAVLRKSPCPVLTVGPRVGQSAKAPGKAGNQADSQPDGKADGPIIFATDFDFSTIHAIRYAARFANLNGWPLHCLHVLPRTLEAGAQCEIVPSIMSEALQQVAAESGAVLDPPTCATTFGSEISYAVVDYAREHRARLIVLGVRQASLLASHVPEHITYRIITEASCPVLTMAFSSDPHAVRAANHS